MHLMAWEGRSTISNIWILDPAHPPPSFLGSCLDLLFLLTTLTAWILDPGSCPPTTFVTWILHGSSVPADHLDSLDPRSWILPTHHLNYPDPAWALPLLTISNVCIMWSLLSSYTLLDARARQL